jgi:hypothetical protein
MFGRLKLRHAKQQRRHLAGCRGGILPAQVAASRHDSRRDGGATKSFRFQNFTQQVWL